MRTPTPTEPRARRVWKTRLAIWAGAVLVALAIWLLFAPNGCGGPNG